MKSIWKGSISFGLVDIPVDLYSAVESLGGMNFKLLDKKHHSPIYYKRWCEKCKKEVPWSDVLKGIELSKGNYYVLDKEELEGLKPEKTDTIDIVEFVESQQIDPKKRSISSAKRRIDKLL